ncbi:MAG: acyloxyacyl hydrolase [Flavobacteriaceae bacterium]
MNVPKANFSWLHQNIIRVSLLCIWLGHYSGIYAQSPTVDNPLFFAAEINLGKTMEANTNFPETKIQKSALISLGWFHQNKDQEWARRLRSPRTGITFGYVDFGNRDQIGYAITLMPYFEVHPFAKSNQRWRVKAGLGLSYLSKQFDSVTNPFNRAVSTDFKWSFRSLLYYDLTKRKKTTWRVGVGYTHHSNGHTRLPNQGLNSFVAALEAEFMSGQAVEKLRPLSIDSVKTKTKQRYLSFRAGLGQNVLSEVFNDKKEVYTAAISYGKIVNSTFKLGIGLFYRVYEHYYDYIDNNEALVQELYPHFADDPLSYSSNIGVMVEGELLLGHVGAELDIGFNIIKPAYKIDWQLNEGDTFQSGGETVTTLGELDTYYELKRSIPTRIGVKWYFISTNKNPIHNVFIGAHINANFGQADFTALSLGYEYRFEFKKKN